MLSVIIQALTKSVMFLCTPFANHCLIYSYWAFEITLYSRQDLPCVDSPDRNRDSPDHRSDRNKGVKFIGI